MRTKIVLAAAAALALGLASSSAQVYSANIVGYINLQLTNGFNLVANQLDLDLTGTNNSVVEVFSNTLPVNSTVSIFSGGSFQTVVYAKSGKGASATTNWSGNLPLNPGQGCFVYIPPGTVPPAVTLGNVLQSTRTNSYLLQGGISLLSAVIPFSGDLETNLTFGTPGLNDTVSTWNPALNSGAGGYVTYVYAKSGKGASAVTNWSPSVPQISPGQGFFLYDPAASDVWVMTLTNQ